jgi:hypothetical protein
MYVSSLATGVVGLLGVGCSLIVVASGVLGLALVSLLRRRQSRSSSRAASAEHANVSHPVRSLATGGVLARRRRYLRCCFLVPGAGQRKILVHTPAVSLTWQGGRVEIRLAPDCRHAFARIDAADDIPSSS